MTDYRKNKPPYESADSGSESDRSTGSLRLYKMPTVNSLMGMNKSTEKFRDDDSSAEMAITPVEELGSLLHNLNINSAKQLPLPSKSEDLRSIPEDLVPGLGQTLTAKIGKIVWDRDISISPEKAADLRPRVDWSPVKNILKSILKNPVNKKPPKKHIHRVKFEVEDTIKELKMPESSIPTTDKPFNFIIKRIGGVLESKPQQKSIFGDPKTKENQQLVDVNHCPPLQPQSEAAHSGAIATVDDLYWKVHKLIKQNRTMKLVDINAEFKKMYQIEGKPYERFEMTWVALCALPLSKNLHLDTHDFTIRFRD